VEADMKVTREMVVHVAQLAALELTEEEYVLYTEQLNRILEYIDQLQTLDLWDVPPFRNWVPRSQAYRDDVPAPGLDREQALHNAPLHDEQYFKVPKVIGGEP
jgi:aspartyl-tRNA(Asn)/glutamyl-tRNA(Gln) amidotransferase subunit C